MQPPQSVECFMVYNRNDITSVATVSFKDNVVPL